MSFLESPIDVDLAVKITFGKHAGRTLGQVLKLDPTWLDWAVRDNIIKSPTIRDAARRVATAYADEIARKKLSEEMLRR